MKRMITTILIVMLLMAIFAGCARDDRDNNVTPYVSPISTAAPMITQPAATLSPTDVLPDATPGIEQSPIVTQDVDQ